MILEAIIRPHLYRIKVLMNWVIYHIYKMWMDQTLLFCLYYVEIKHSQQRPRGSWNLLPSNFSGRILLFLLPDTEENHKQKRDVGFLSQPLVLSSPKSAWWTFQLLLQYAAEGGIFSIPLFVWEHHPGLNFNSYSMCLCFNFSLLLKYQINLKKIPSC